VWALVVVVVVSLGIHSFFTVFAVLKVGDS
jgi:hypothetical protein